MPRKTIVNVSAPALAGQAEDEPVIERVPDEVESESTKSSKPKKDPLLIEEAELRPSEDAQKEDPPARPKIAAISAPPEPLPLTQKPAIGRREELELDELIPQPETPEAEIKNSVPEESRGIAAPAENSAPEIGQAEACETVETIGQLEVMEAEQAVAVEEKEESPVGEYISETLEQLTTVKQPIAVGQTETVEEVEEEIVPESLFEAFGFDEKTEPQPEATAPVETLTEELPQAEETVPFFDEVEEFEESEETESAPEPEPVEIHVQQKHNFFWTTFITFAVITAAIAAGLALWISRNMETESKPVSAIIVDPAETALSDRPDETAVNSKPSAKAIAGFAFDRETSGKNTTLPENPVVTPKPADTDRLEQLQKVSRKPGEILTRNFQKIKLSAQAARDKIVDSTLALHKLQASLERKANQAQFASLSTPAISTKPPLQRIEVKNKIVIGLDLNSCTRLPDDDGAVILIGLAENNGNETLRDILVACDFFTVNGVYAGTARAKLKGDVTKLAAGEKVKYAIVFPASDAGFNPSRIKFAPPRLLAEKRNSRQ